MDSFVRRKNIWTETHAKFKIVEVQTFECACHERRCRDELRLAHGAGRADTAHAPRPAASQQRISAHPGDLAQEVHGRPRGEARRVHAAAMRRGVLLARRGQGGRRLREATGRRRAHLLHTAAVRSAVAVAPWRQRVPRHRVPVRGGGRGGLMRRVPQARWCSESTT